MLSEIILKVMLAISPPGVSMYSVVPVPECGFDRVAQACATLPQGEPFRWSNALGGYVRLESPAEGTLRYRAIAQAIEAVSERMSQARVVDGYDEPPVWLYPARELAYGLATIAYHESGYRRDVHEGIGAAALGDCRKGKGNSAKHCNSVCLTQINMGGLSGRKHGYYGSDLVGLDGASMRRCFTVAARILAAARNRCSRRTPGNWFQGAIYAYGSGANCVDHGPTNADKWVAPRVRTYQRFVAG